MPLIAEAETVGGRDSGLEDGRYIPRFCQLLFFASFKLRLAPETKLIADVGDAPAATATLALSDLEEEFREFAFPCCTEDRD